MIQIEEQETEIRPVEIRSLNSSGELVIGDRRPPPMVIGGGDEARVVRYFARRWMFLTIIVLPNLISAAYFGFIASPIYVSEARFFVRSAGGDDAGGLGALVRNQGLSRAADETYAVNEYITSRDAVAAMAQEHNLREIFSRPEADFVNRFPNFFTRNNFEQLYLHFQGYVRTAVEGSTGISTIEVQAFRPEDARSLAAALLVSAENLINRLNDRARQDAIDYATDTVKRANASLLDIEDRLTVARNKEKIIDPRGETEGKIKMITEMETELAKARAELDQQITLAPTGPGAASTLARITGYQKQIDTIRRDMVGSDGSMANKLSIFDGLELERELAIKQLQTGLLSLGKAKQSVQQQRVYLQTIAEPNLPDQPSSGRRLTEFVLVLAFSGLCYSIVRSLLRVVREHQA